jgi:hypothetical protein
MPPNFGDHGRYDKIKTNFAEQTILLKAYSPVAEEFQHP